MKLRRILLSGAFALLSQQALAVTDARDCGAIPGTLVGVSAGQCFYMKVNSDGSINTTSYTDPSVGPNGNAAPTSSSQIGYKDGSGNLQPAGSTTPLPIQGQAGTAIMGKVGIDQTTPGTTNGVQVNAAIPAGSNIIGKVTIDQTTPGTTNAISAVGNAASLAADSGNPVKTGAVYNTVNVAPTNAQRVDNQANNIGSISVSVNASVPAGADGVANTIAKLACTNAAASLVAQCVQNVNAYLFNGSTWDRPFTCPSTAAVNVTAGSTTQIVGLSGTTVIRVCSVSLGISVTGTVNVVTGTGTNCGTPTTISNAIPLATGQLWQQATGPGVSLFRSTAGGEICIAAVTGNVTGFITYAQY
jgi:hypothetical protein